MDPTKTCNLHVSRFICQQFSWKSSRCFPDFTFMEWLGLVKLFSILCSLLISMDILFRGPTCTVPQSAIHYITRTIINKWLPWAIDICFIKNMLINSYCLLVGKFLIRNSRPENLTWMSLRVNIRCSERSLAWHVWSMIIWMR